MLLCWWSGCIVGEPDVVCTLCLSILSQLMKLKTIAVPYGMREGSGTIADGMTVSFSEM